MCVCVCACERASVSVRAGVFFLTGKLFCLHAKSCFSFLGISSVLSCFLPTVAVFFFMLPPYLSPSLGNISSSLSLFYGALLLLHLPVMLVLYPFHNLWCFYFPCQLSLLYWRLSLFLWLSLSSLFSMSPQQPLFSTQILEILRYFWPSSGDLISLSFTGDILLFCCCWISSRESRCYDNVV